MAKKVIFTSKTIAEIFYEIVGEKWMDKDTYLIVFQTMTDKDGDDFHIEVEFHKDDGKIYYSRCYEEEVVDGTAFVSPCFKKQIEEYILRQVGALRTDSFLNTQTIEVELKLDVPKDMTMGEFDQWLKDLAIEVKSPQADRVRVLGINNKGKVYGK
jgi:hypothetical protein